MLYNATKRELLEGLIVAELIARRGQGPLARRHFPQGGRGPASGVRSIAARARARPVASEAVDAPAVIVVPDTEGSAPGEDEGER